VLSIFVVMLGTSIMRVVGLRTGGFEEIIAWLTAAAAFTGLASTFKHGDFVRVELLITRLPRGSRRAAELTALGIGTAFLGYMAWSTSAYVLDSYRFGDMANGLIAIPIWIPQLSFIVGTVLLFVAMVDELVRVALGSRPTYVVAVEERHARGDFTEDV
jgi:TRAP-type C4-dicarboxylate transport system permease small subunit